MSSAAGLRFGGAVVKTAVSFKENGARVQSRRGRFAPESPPMKPHLTSGAAALYTKLEEQ